MRGRCLLRSVDVTPLFCDNGGMNSPRGNGDFPYSDSSSFHHEPRFGQNSPHPPSHPHPPSQPFPGTSAHPAAPVGPARGSRASGALIGGIAVAVIALMLVAGVGVGMWLNGRDSGASGGPGGDGPVAPVAQPTTVVGQQAQPETVTVTEEAREDAGQTRHTATSTPRTWSSTPTDLGTGRSDVDSYGWKDSYARCGMRGQAVAVLKVRDSAGDPMLTVACMNADGPMYYRGTGTAGDLEADIIVDAGDRIVAQNGAWKYQMSPSGLVITENNVVKHSYPAEVWGAE